MKREHIGLIGVVIAVILIIIAACSNNLKTASPPVSSSPPSPAVSIKPPPSLSPSHAPSLPPPEGTFTVKTDYSQLVPYEPPEEIYTRLSEDYISELVLSEDYGELLRYTGEIIYDEYGYTADERYGLITVQGRIVTDAIYSSIYRIIDGSSFIYLLVQPVERTPNPDDNSELYALCATDGHWMTPFEYCDYWLFDQVLLLIRDYVSNDIDVYDYKGTFLYNLKDLAFSQDIPSSYFFVSDNDHFISYGEGFFSIPLENGIVAFVDELTGIPVYTGYTEVRGFSEGYAAVKQNGLWGYIDKQFNTLIDPIYQAAYDFEYGRVDVELTDGSYAVIDSNNKILLQADDINYYSGLFEVEKNGMRRFYDYNLNEMNAHGASVEPFEDDWYANINNGNLIIYHNGEETMFKGMMQPISMHGNLIICSAVNYIYGHALYTLDGSVILPMRKGTDIAFGINGDSELKYILVNDSESGTYKVLDTDYSVLFNGEGTIYYDQYYNMFCVSSDMFFGYMDTTGNYIFRISLQDDIPD